VTILNENQTTQLKEIISNLRAIREEKSISIEEIAHQTCIRLLFLQALEAYNFELLPEPIFIQGFIRRYAEALGLDGNFIASQFTINIISPEPHTKSEQKQFKPFYIPLYIPYILLLSTASFGLFYILNSHAKSKLTVSQSRPVVSPAISQPVVSSSPSSLPQSNTTPKVKAISQPIISPTTSVEKVVVTLELQGESWLQIKADGKTEFQGTLNKGQKKSWTAQKTLTVRSGNAGAVLISVNQQQAQLLGNAGQVKEVTYPSN
jgi:cytoskeletal protein RodZ